MDQSKPLYTAGDVPVTEAPVPGSAEAVVRLCPCWETEEPAPWCSGLVPFFVTVFKALDNCHPDVQVPIKLCKDKGRALKGSSDFTLSSGGDWCSPRGLFGAVLFSLFPTLAHIENGAVLLAFWDEKPGQLGSLQCWGPFPDPPVLHTG